MRHYEEDLQEQCVKWFELQYPKLKWLLHHSPNGGRRTTIEGQRFKRMGTRAGFPDLQLCFPNRKFHGLFIELKSKKGQQRPTQKLMQGLLEEVGYKYELVRDFYSFVDCIRRYLTSKDEN